MEKTPEEQGAELARKIKGFIREMSLSLRPVAGFIGVIIGFSLLFLIFE